MQDSEESCTQESGSEEDSEEGSQKGCQEDNEEVSRILSIVGAFKAPHYNSPKQKSRKY